MKKFYLYFVTAELKQRPVFVEEITASDFYRWTQVDVYDVEEDAIKALKKRFPVAEIKPYMHKYDCSCGVVTAYEVDDDGNIVEDCGDVFTSAMPPLPMTFEAYGSGNTLYLDHASAIISASCPVPDDCENEDYGYFAMKNAILAALSKDPEGSALQLSFPYDDAPESSFSPDAYADAHVDVDLCFF